MDEGGLYETDFIGWAEQQGQRLREIAGRPGNDALDWSNIAEEIESLGVADRRAVKSHAERLIEHLLKLEHSPAIGPRAGWIDTVDHARSEIASYLEDEPGLRARLPEIVAAAHRRGRADAALALRRHGELRAADAADAAEAAPDYGMDRLLGEWLPGTAHGTGR